MATCSWVPGMLTPVMLSETGCSTWLGLGVGLGVGVGIGLGGALGDRVLHLG